MFKKGYRMQRVFLRILKLVFKVHFLFLSFHAVALAQDLESITPVGFWKTIDDVTGEPKAIVEIQDIDGSFKGIIRKTFSKPGDKSTCELCPGDKKDKPIVDMEILWGLKKDGNEYVGGEILDPKNGKTYKAKLELIEQGKKLKVRGFIGFSLIGRTQVWHRADKL